MAFNLVRRRTPQRGRHPNINVIGLTFMKPSSSSTGCGAIYNLPTFHSWVFKAFGSAVLEERTLLPLTWVLNYARAVQTERTYG